MISPSAKTSKCSVIARSRESWRIFEHHARIMDWEPACIPLSSPAGADPKDYSSRITGSPGDQDPAPALAAASHQNVSMQGMTRTARHMELWSDLLKRGEPFHFIFEDDCIVTGNPQTLRPPDDADLILLEHSCHGAHPEGSADPVEFDELADRTGVVPAAAAAISPAAYMITRQGAEKLLKAIRPEQDLADQLRRMAGGGDASVSSLNVYTTTAVHARRQGTPGRQEASASPRDSWGGGTSVRFDLGGIGRGGELTTVNINAVCDVEADFTDLDKFCGNNSVDEFRLSHALEHVPSQLFKKFLKNLFLKLKPGGRVVVVHSDAKKTVELFNQGLLSFRAMRTVLFPPADRLRQNPYHQHFNMWGGEELAQDFTQCGFSPVKTFDAGFWPLDTTDEMHPGHVEAYHGRQIPNLGVEAFKPCFSEEDLQPFEARVFSQNGEDGVIQRLLALLGIQAGNYLEIGTGSGEECNCRLLRERCGFTGTGMDSDHDNPDLGISQCFVTVESVTEMISTHNPPSHINILSIDIDGNDYWIWRELCRHIEFDIVVIEYNAAFGADADAVIPYDPYFKWTGTDYHGASLTALRRLGNLNGYTLVYAESQGVNAFFVRTALLKSVGFINMNSPGLLFRAARHHGGRGHPADGRTAGLLGSPGSGAIPRTIHQTWRTREIQPPFREEWRESWTRMNPSWDYKLWTDEDLNEFIRINHPAFLPIYNGYDSMIKRVDAARYLILKTLGGLFVDLDFVCLKPMDPLIEGRQLVFGCQHPGDWLHSEDHVCNAWMASVPGHPFWNGIEFDLENHASLHVLEATSPNFLTLRVKNCPFFMKPGDHPHIEPNSVLYPFAWNSKDKETMRTKSPDELGALFPEAYGVTLWTASWW